MGGVSKMWAHKLRKSIEMFNIAFREAKMFPNMNKVLKIVYPRGQFFPSSTGRAPRLYMPLWVYPITP